MRAKNGLELLSMRQPGSGEQVTQAEAEILMSAIYLCGTFLWVKDGGVAC